jgi:uncharacterized protein YggE
VKPIRIAAFVLIAAAVVAFAGVGRPESAGGAAKSAGGITVSGTGTVTSVPNQAEFSLGVQTNGSTAREALAKNSQEMHRVIAALSSAGVEKRDIKTQDVSVSPSYADEGQVSGFSARNSVTVTIRELSKAGDVLDAASNAGANEIYGPTLTRSDQEGQQRKALRSAFADARVKAEALADAAGVRLGSVTAITEGFSGGPEPYFAPVPGARVMADKSPPIEPGTQDAQATVTVTFAIS